MRLLNGRYTPVLNDNGTYDDEPHDPHPSEYGSDIDVDSYEEQLLQNGGWEGSRFDPSCSSPKS